MNYMYCSETYGHIGSTFAFKTDSMGYFCKLFPLCFLHFLNHNIK